MRFGPIPFRDPCDTSSTISKRLHQLRPTSIQMSSYLITGVSRGLGLSEDPKNVVIGIVRDKAATEKKVAQELEGRTNISILEADITDYNALKGTVDAVSAITGGSLDYLVANAGYVSRWDAYDPIGVLGQKPEELDEDFLKSFKINVLGNIHLFNLYTPLILKGQAKKVITISSGLADLDPIWQFDSEVAAGYSISKAAMNIAVAKFSAQYRKEGVLFISISPGMADVGQYSEATPEQLQKLGGMLQKFMEYAPHFKGPTTPEAAVKDVIAVWEQKSVENGDGGNFVSHHGDKNWL
ncbi:Short chain dehydrogenase virK [Paramyrothecium foliicola]|nr:Short chain dehydrogenase virK [Paramyrothecium foliicola]